MVVRRPWAKGAEVSHVWVRRVEFAFDLFQRVDQYLMCEVGASEKPTCNDSAVKLGYRVANSPFLDSDTASLCQLCPAPQCIHSERNSSSFRSVSGALKMALWP
jgi:hypothetical protein